MKKRFILLIVLLVAITAIFIAQFITPLKILPQRWSGEVYIDKDVIVLPTSTLIIEPGTTVKFAAYRRGYTTPDHRIGIIVRGKLIAKGTAEKPIRFTSAAEQPEHGDWNGLLGIENCREMSLDHVIVEFAWTGVGGSNCDFNLTNSIVRWSTGGNVFFKYSDPIIIGNRIYQSGHCNVEFENSHPTISNNTIWGAGTNGVFADDSSRPTVRYNLIKDNKANGVATDFSTAVVEYNIITGNQNGIGIDGRSPASESVIRCNNIYDNDMMVSLSDTTENLNATNNWWGIVDKNIIEDEMHDSRDDPNLGNVFYEPFLTSEVDIPIPVHDFVNEEQYPHVPGSENDTYQYVFPDDETRRIVRSWYPGAGFPAGIAFDGEHVWVGTNVDNKIRMHDFDGNIIKEFPTPGPQVWGLAWDGSYLWVADYEQDTIYQIDTDGNIIKSIPAPYKHPIGLAWDGQYLYTLPWEDNGVAYQFDTTGKVIRKFRVPGEDGIAFDGQYFWIANNEDDRIYQVDSNGKIIKWITAPADRTFDCAWAEGYLWCTDWTNEIWEDARVFQMEILV